MVAYASTVAGVARDSFQQAAVALAKVAEDEDLHVKLYLIAEQTVKTLRCGGTLFACGNGGSAAQATHVTGELVGTFVNRNRRPLRAIPLGFDPASTTAISNDLDYRLIFSRQLQALGQAGDMLWAFSTSGNSANVLTAMQTAKSIGISTTLFCNRDGGKGRDLADYLLSTPESSTARIQELHLLYAHILCEIIDSRFND